MGNFNVIPNVGESHGGLIKWSPVMIDFKECLQHTELEDLKYNRILYSCSNRSLGTASIAKKLDRALINQMWTSTFPFSECTFLTLGISNHSPILVSMDFQIPRRCIHFRFFNAWATHQNFSTSVHNVWKTFIRGTAMFQVVQKLKFLKPVLKEMSWKDFLALDSKLHAVKVELDACQLDHDCFPSDVSLREMERSLISKFLKLTNHQKDVLREKSRMTWLKFGDSNSAYFHKSLSSKNNEKKILSITTDSGQIIDRKDGIIIEIVGHFQRLLGISLPTTHTLSELQPFITAQVLSHLKALLDEIPSPLDI
ncbi:uncharacterized protein LOC132316528 [Cornus florida]|uniref:uncharacterized protein LOC132316528 n=1 Tax=Cornus florida TaxID=4283 RepID=UPI0028A04ABC|nr:uncharacterized protein LOC132316528 [Cornus florida]